jgi:short-subunit dehydrogenase
MWIMKLRAVRETRIGRAADLRSRTLRGFNVILVALALGIAGCASTRDANMDKTIVIAGASSGFGKGVALELANQRANLVLAARRTGLLEDLARECEARGAKTLVVTTDVSDDQAVRRLADAAVAQFGSIDVWINMAGVGALGRFEDVPLADHERVVDVNLKGVISGSYYAMRRFRQQGQGTLINIASVAGRVPFPYYSSYVATKHAIVGLGGVLNQELRVNGEKNIHVTTINPFAADTPWFDHAANYSGHQPRTVMPDPPEKVVHAIVAATVKPRPEINVGYKANMAAASHRIARRATENINGSVFNKAMIEDSAPAERTAGSLYEPMAEGTTIDGNVRQRLAEGDLKKVER